MTPSGAGMVYHRHPSVGRYVYPAVQGQLRSNSWLRPDSSQKRGRQSRISFGGDEDHSNRIPEIKPIRLNRDHSPDSTKEQL